MFPDRRFVQHGKLAVEGIKRKIHQFNSLLEPERSDSVYVMSEDDFVVLDSMLAVQAKNKCNA